MARGHEVVIGADARPFEKAVKDDLIKPVEQAARALDDLGDVGARDIGKLEDAMKDAQRQSEKLERSAGDVGGSRGIGKASAASKEFKQEALANFSEVTSSFDGSMESIGELAQGTLGGIASSIPGIGLAAGGIAVGIGAMTAELGKISERSEEVKSEIIADFVEVGDALDKEAVDSRVRDILGTKDTLKQATDLRDVLGVTLGQAALILAGDFESAGVSAEDALEAIATNSEKSAYELIGLEESIKAADAAMKAGPEIAQARADAEKATAQTVKQTQQATRDEFAKTADKLRQIPGTIPAPRFGPLDFSTLDRQIRNYRPPRVSITGVLTDRFGREAT